ncbi:hypothetical protein [Cognatishimia sp.]|uniref:hypothetical protein n=1 Tax=Cognatishimia sp. TaxID=2211648 RepID=UPI003511A077|nr:hypothetical protein [Cognatishimia sp.]
MEIPTSEVLLIGIEIGKIQNDDKYLLLYLQQIEYLVGGMHTYLKYDLELQDTILRNYKSLYVKDRIKRISSESEKNQSFNLHDEIIALLTS